MADDPRNLLKRKHAATVAAGKAAETAAAIVAGARREGRREPSRNESGAADPRRATQYASHLQSLAAKKPKRLFPAFDRAVAGTNLSTKKFAMRKQRPHPDNVITLNLEDIAFVDWPDNNPEALATWMKGVDLNFDVESLRGVEMYVLPPQEDLPAGPSDGPVLGSSKHTLIPKYMWDILTSKKPRKLVSKSNRVVQTDGPEGDVDYVARPNDVVRSTRARNINEGGKLAKLPPLYSEAELEERRRTRPRSNSDSTVQIDIEPLVEDDSTSTASRPRRASVGSVSASQAAAKDDSAAEVTGEEHVEQVSMGTSTMDLTESTKDQTGDVQCSDVPSDAFSALQQHDDAEGEEDAGEPNASDGESVNEKPAAYESDSDPPDDFVKNRIDWSQMITFGDCCYTASSNYYRDRPTPAAIGFVQGPPAPAMAATASIPKPAPKASKAAAVSDEDSSDLEGPTAFSAQGQKPKQRGQGPPRLPASPTKGPKKGRAKPGKTSMPLKEGPCFNCSETESVEWRNWGVDKQQTCNKCYLTLKRKAKKEASVAEKPDGPSSESSDSGEAGPPVKPAKGKGKGRSLALSQKSLEAAGDETEPDDEILADGPAPGTTLPMPSAYRPARIPSKPDFDEGDSRPGTAAIKTKKVVLTVPSEGASNAELPANLVETADDVTETDGRRPLSPKAHQSNVDGTKKGRRGAQKKRNHSDTENVHQDTAVPKRPKAKGRASLPEPAEDPDLDEVIRSPVTGSRSSSSGRKSEPVEDLARPEPRRMASRSQASEAVYDLLQDEAPGKMGTKKNIGRSKRSSAAPVDEDPVTAAT